MRLNKRTYFYERDMTMILSSAEQIGEYTQKEWWGTETIIDKLYTRAKAIPASEALVDPYNKKDLVGLDPMRMTYGQMIQPIDRLALKFLQLGIKKDDVIIVQLPNIIELTLTIFAAARAGAIASPIPIQWRAHEIRHAVKLTEAKIFVSSHNLLGFDHISMVRKAVEEGVRCITSLPSDPVWFRKLSRCLISWQMTGAISIP